MSSLVVDVNIVEEILPHPNADNLEIVHVKGWQVCIQKGSFKSGDLGVYFPPDSLLTEELCNRLGIWKYTSKGKIKGIRLRGEPSYGLFIPLSEFPELKDSKVGDDVTQLLGVEKWEPPPEFATGDMEVSHPLFHKYTDIENYGNFPNVFDDDEFVILTEKIHGCNSRIGLVENEWMAGSHNVRKKMPDIWAENLYWYPLTYAKGDCDKDGHSDVQQMLIAMTGEMYKAKSVILFGEVYGWVQKLRYGHKPGKISFVAIDLSIDEKYLSWFEFYGIMKLFNIPIVPVIEIAKLEYIKDIGLDKFASGKTKILGPDGNPIDQIREGFVMKPVKERRAPDIGRVILKVKNIDYVSGNYE